MDKTFELVIDSTIEKIPEISALLGEEMQTFGFGSEIILDTQLAVEEAITNVINHGYKKTVGEIFQTEAPEAGQVPGSLYLCW